MLGNDPSKPPESYRGATGPPRVQIGPLNNVPVFPSGEWSATVVPEPAFILQYPTRPGSEPTTSNAMFN